MRPWVNAALFGPILPAPAAPLEEFEDSVLDGRTCCTASHDSKTSMGRAVAALRRAVAAVELASTLACSTEKRC